MRRRRIHACHMRKRIHACARKQVDHRNQMRVGRVAM
jgi:hypothetical protein